MMTLADRRWTIAVSALMAAGVAAQDFELGTERNAFLRPLAELPKHVPSRPEEITLFADYEAKDGGGRIPIYLVNRTERALRIPSQDGDIYLKLERMGLDGAWERAESHGSSWCGNSYVAVVLGPGQFYVYPGYAAMSGEQSLVRYASYGLLRLVSNEGRGLVDPAEAAAAKEDSLALHHIPFPIRNSLIDDLYAPRAEREPLPRRIAALRLLQTYFDCAKLRSAAPAMLQAAPATALPSNEQWEAREAVGAALKAKPPRRPDPDALFERCFAALAGTDTPGEYGSPSTQPGLVWEVLLAMADALFSRNEQQFDGARCESRQRGGSCCQKWRRLRWSRSSRATSGIQSLSSCISIASRMS